MSIPKRIFYVWGAKEEKRRDVLACIQTWREVCPEYEIIEINEESTEFFNFQEELKNNKWFKVVYERKMFAYVADYIRIKTLFDNGGIYLDTDVSVLKKFDMFLNDPAFVGMQDCKKDGRDNLVEPAVLGATKGNNFLKKILEIYNENSENNIWNLPIYNMPEVFKYVLEDIYEEQDYPVKNEQVKICYEDIIIYPERYFIPYRYQETFSPQCVTKDTYTIHWFGGSWMKRKVVHYLENKIKYPDAPLYRTISILGLPLFKVVDLIKLQAKELLLFGVIPIISMGNYHGKFRVFLFNFIPLLKIREDWGGKRKFYLFGFIPFVKIQ